MRYRALQVLLALFAGWSTLAHVSVMIVQGVQHQDLRGDLLGFSIIAIIGLALVALSPSLRREPALSGSLAYSGQ